VYLLLADGAICHKATATIAKLIMIAWSKIAILLILPAVPTGAQLAGRTSGGLALII
jgi:hypothetical protein